MLKVFDNFKNKQIPSGRRQSIKNLLALILFGIAFGYVEAAVVVYLRQSLNFVHHFTIGHYRVVLNLGVIEFVKMTSLQMFNIKLAITEVYREMATIVMLIMVSYISARTLKRRIGAFMISFAMWDIFYYVFLKILINWPYSLFTKDIYFLIPIPWIGPILTPVICSLIIFIFGIKLYIIPRSDKKA